MMTENNDLNDIVSSFTDEQTRLWMEQHLPELRQTVSGQRLVYQSLVISFVIGLAAHIGGYLLLLSAPAGLLGLLADLLHALGWSLWTGAVVAVFIQVLPEVKRRQIKQAVEAYEAARREKARAVNDRDGTASEAPPAKPAGSKQGQRRLPGRARKGG